LLNGQYRQARSPNPDRNTNFLSLDQNISELMFLTVEAFIIQLIAEDAVGGNDMSDAPRLLDAIANFNKAAMRYPLRVLFNSTMHRDEDWYRKLEDDGFEPQKHILCTSLTRNSYGRETHDLINETIYDGSYDELAAQVDCYLTYRNRRLRDYSELLQRGLIFVVKSELFARLEQDPAFFPYAWTKVDQYDRYCGILGGDKCVHVEDNDIPRFLEVIVRFNFNANMPF